MNKKINIIEPINLNKKTRIAAYARVSSNSKDQKHSFNSQVAYYMDYVNQLPDSILVNIYTDEGITGTAIKKRKGFLQMLADCRDGKIDRIVTKSISRFGRNIKETLQTMRNLKSLGVSIYFEEENIDTNDSVNEILFVSNALNAEYESKNISNTQKWGFRTRAERGIYNQPNLPYGYYKENNEIKVNETEAEIIKKIFHMYVVEGISATKISKHLNENNIGNRKWAKTSLSYLLQNERYCGDQLLQKRYSTNDFPFRLVRNNGDLPQYYVYDTFPKIIERETYEKACIKIENTRRKFNPNQQSENKVYPYTSKIICEECERTFKRRIYRGEEYWVCREHLLNKKKCTNIQISRVELDEAFMKLYYKLLNSIDILEEYHKRMLVIAIENNDKKELLTIEKKIEELNREKSHILNENLCRRLTDVERVKELNKVHTYKQLYNFKKKKKLYEIFSSKKIVKTKELLELLKQAKEIAQFDEDIFNEIVDRLEIGVSKIKFHLCNDLTITIERKKYYGNYS